MNFINQFITFLLSQKKPASRATIKNYKADIRHFIAWFEKELSRTFVLSDVTPEVILLYKQSKNSSPRSMERYISSLRKFFAFLKTQNIFPNNPFETQALAKTTIDEKKESPWKLQDFKNYLYVTNTASITIKNYISDIEQFLLWLSRVFALDNMLQEKNKSMFDVITKAVVEEYKTRLVKSGFSPRTVNRKLSSLRKYLTFAQNEGYLANKPQIFDMPLFQLLTKPEQPKAEPMQEQKPKQYAWFPPLRLVQKTSNASLFFFDSIISEPLAHAIKKTKDTFSTLRKRPLFFPIKTYQSPWTVTGITKEAYAPFAISTAHFPFYKKIWHNIIYSRPQWYNRYKSNTFARATHLSLIVLFITACAIFAGRYLLNQQLKNQLVLGLKTDAVQTKKLSFQGKLMDTNRTPITKAATVTFLLYNDPTTPSPIWEESQTIKPTNDGTFTTNLGSATPIARQLFTDNDTLFLGIQVNGQAELLPRQQLANVQYAQNAQTLQGLPVSTQSNSPTNNVVLALDSSGNLTIGKTASPIFQATGGDFTLLGQSVVLSTIPGSNGNIQLSPQGDGVVDIQKPIQNTSQYSSTGGVPGAVEIADLLSVVATNSSQSAFTINQNDVGPIISASRSGTAKFTVENDGTTYIAGNLGIGIQMPLAKLQVQGNIAPSETNTYDVGTPSFRFNNLFVNSIIASSSGTLGYWQRTNTNVTPSNINDALNIGASDTNSAIAHIAGLPNQNSFIKSGNVGIGTQSPNARLTIQGTGTTTNPVFTTQDSNGNKKFTITDAGNVGIGTSSPESALAVIGGVQVGSPTGGDKGNGSINIAGDIYKNGTAYNNPDYVFEKWTTGNIVKFSNNAGASHYTGILSLEDTEAFVKQTLQLPRVASATGIFERNDILLEKVEEAYIHLFDLNRKISSFIETLTTKKIISPIAQIDQIHTNLISPLSDDADIAISLSKDAITIQNASGSPVARIDNKGNAQFNGTLTAQSLSTTDASISGILRAKKIIVDEIESATSSASILNSQLSTLNSIDIASYSGQLSLSNINASFGKFTQGLFALGPTSLTDTTIFGDLHIGKNLTISDESLNVIGADINLQPLRQGGVSFLSGLVYIDTDGNVSVVNNATFGKDVTVQGTLSAGIISPLPDSDLTISLSRHSGLSRIDSGVTTPSASPQNDVNGKLVIQNSSGSAVLSINSIGDLVASGEATIRKLNLNVPQAIAISDTEIQAYGSAGIATISAQRATLTIDNPQVTDKSLIYISPRDQTDNQVLYLLRQAPNTSFTVGIQQAAKTNVSFNWLIVN